MSGPSWSPFLRFPRASLVASILLCLPLLAPLSRFEVASEVRALLQGDERNLASYEKVREILADTEAVVVSLAHDHLFSTAGLDAVRRVSEALNRLPEVVDVRSLTHAVRPVRRGMSFEMVPLISTTPSEGEIEAFRDFCLSHPLVRNLMVAADARHTLITVTLRQKAVTDEAQRDLTRTLNDALRPFHDEGLRFRLLAVPLIEEEVRGTLRGDLIRFVPAAFVIVTAILAVTFRSWLLVVLVLANQAVALALLPGLVAATGLRLNLFSVMLLPLLTGIHLTLLIHVVTAFQQVRARGIPSPTALVESVSLTARPCLFASLTTILGLLSLALSRVPQLREFGLLGALGVTVVHLLAFGPALATLAIASPWMRTVMAPTLPSAEPPSPIDRLWSARLLDWVRRHRLWIVGMAGLLALVGMAGMRLIRTDLRAVEFLDRQSPTRLAIEELDEVYGGINVVRIEFETGAENGVNQLEFLNFLESVQRYAEMEPDLAGAYSYAQLLAMIHQIWEGGAPEALRLPDHPVLLHLFVIALKSYDFPFLAGLTDNQFRSAFLILRTRDLPSGRYLALIDRVVRFAERGKPPGVRLSAAAGIHSIIEADRRITRSLVDSAGLTAGTIWLMLALLWRSPRLATLALFTNAVPLAVVAVVAAGLDIPLNSVTVMVAAISLGITVDDSVHVLTVWQRLRRDGLTPTAAVLETLRRKGRPIIATSLILTAVCTLFWISSFPPVVDFGWLSAAAFACALIAVLILLPALLLQAGSPDQRMPSSPTT